MNDVLKTAIAAVDAAVNAEHTFVEARRPVITALPKVVSIDDVLKERRAIHGDFSDDASASQRLKAVMRAGDNWERLTEVQREALELIATKIGRILSGDPDHKDHWSDVQGYARLVEQRL